MPKLQQDIHNETLLVFNCHEAWVYQLCALGCALEIIVGLRGRYRQSWDLHMRPLPPNSRLISLPEALDSPRRYYCIVTHNITDLLDIKARPEPRLVVLHSTLEGRVIEEGSSVTPQEMRKILSKYLAGGFPTILLLRALTRAIIGRIQDSRLVAFASAISLRVEKRSCYGTFMKELSRGYLFGLSGTIRTCPQ
ncbi:MAG: hypothetical protein ACYTAO_23930 [Planctomycetota bacterium]|jgi:hypothetical protein